MGFKLTIFSIFVLIASYVIYQIIRNGPHKNFSCSIFYWSCPYFGSIHLTKDSKYDKKFEKVITEFKKNFFDGYDIGAQLSVYHNAKNVINISSGKRNLEKNFPYELNTL